MPDWLLQLLGSLVVAMPGILALVLGARKSRAEAADLVTKAALTLVEPQNVRIREMAVRIEEQETEIAELKTENMVLFRRIGAAEQINKELERVLDEFDRLLAGAHRLHNQVIDLNAVPVFVPPDRRKGGTGELRMTQ